MIFITAFPERLLTGERPEPTFLITKPFDPETLSVSISQALATAASASRSLRVPAEARGGRRSLSPAPASLAQQPQGADGAAPRHCPRAAGRLCRNPGGSGLLAPAGAAQRLAAAHGRSDLDLPGRDARQVARPPGAPGRPAGGRRARRPAACNGLLEQEIRASAGLAALYVVDATGRTVCGSPRSIRSGPTSPIVAGSGTSWTARGLP